MIYLNYSNILPGLIYHFIKSKPHEQLLMGSISLTDTSPYFSNLNALYSLVTRKVRFILCYLITTVPVYVSNPSAVTVMVCSPAASPSALSQLMKTIL